MRRKCKAKRLFGPSMVRRTPTEWQFIARLATIHVRVWLLPFELGGRRGPPAARAKALDPFGWQSPPATQLRDLGIPVAGGLRQPMGSGALGPSRRRPPVVPQFR